MKKTIKCLAAVICLTLLCGAFLNLDALIPAAKAAGNGQGYRIIVAVTDLSADGAYGSCTNSDGYIVIPTRKQDGTAGPTWSVPVKSYDWDEENETRWYSTGGSCWGYNTLVLNSNTLWDGFPTEIRLTKTNSATATDYITNDNYTYITKQRFTVYVYKDSFLYGDASNLIEIQSWTEITNVHGKFSDPKKVDTGKYPKAWSVSDISGASEIQIPRPGETAVSASYTALVNDQYGFRWHQDNDGVTFSLSGAPNGVSITSSGVLTVNSSVLNLSSIGDTQVTVVAKGQDGATRTKQVTLRWPQNTVSYYSEGKRIGSFQAYYNSTWTHTIANPAKSPDGNGHYTFVEWSNSADSMKVTGDMTFTAVFSSAQAHSFAPNATYTQLICGVCGYTVDGTLSDVLAGEGTPGKPWQIQSERDWNFLADYINAGLTLSGDPHFALTQNLAVTRMIGTEGRPFTGVFDGGGHTLTANLSSSDSFCAPFNYISNATIQNLTAAGTVSGGMHCAGLVGGAKGTNTIQNCAVTASITTSGTHCGGVLGHAGTSDTTVKYVVFAGSISGARTVGTIWGWGNSGARADINHCLDVTTSAYPIRNGNYSFATYSHNYQTNPDKPCECSSLAYSVSASEGVSMQMLSTYSIWPGVFWDGRAYASEGENVRLTLSADAPNGLKVNGFITDAGRLTYGGSTWTLTMPGGNVVISSGGFVPQLGQGTQADPWKINGSYSYPNLVTGWYEVIENVAISKRIVVTGDVHLILGAGTTFTAAQGVSVYSNQSLTVDGSGALLANASALAQAAGIGGSYADGAQRSSGTITINSGTVTATGGQYGAGIGGGMYGFCGPVTINGGTVTATAGTRGAGIGGGGNYYWNGNYGNTATITVNGGTVTAVGNSTGSGIGGGGGSDSPSSSVKGGNVEAVVINGGRVTATSPNGAGIGPARYSASGSVRLGWNDEGDFIKASSFSGTVAFMEGKFFVLSGTHTLAALDNIDGSHLVPFNSAPEFTLTLTAPVFDAVEVGYARPEAKPITVVSTGNCDATISSAALGGANADSFTLNKTDGATIPAGSTDSTTYTVQPNAGLDVGIYTAIVTVLYNNGSTATAVLSFTVHEKWYPITFEMDGYFQVMMVQTDSHSWSSNNAKAAEGETVWFEPLCCDDRFGIGSVTVTTENGSPVACERYSEYFEEGDFTETGWRFIMPNNPVTVRITLAFGEPDFTLPVFLTKVEAEAFEGIAASILDVPANCTSIGDHAFRNCPNLTQIRIPAGCSLGADVFDGCAMVYVFGTPGSPAESYCNDPAHGNCVFVPVE